MEQPYSAYCAQFMTGFNEWPPAQMNTKLGPALATLSDAMTPPRAVADADGNAIADVWTLDALFLLPRDRLRYYRKLYNRLLKNADSSNDQTLRKAVDTLDMLMRTIDSRLNVSLPPAALSDENQTPGPVKTMSPEPSVILSQTHLSDGSQLEETAKSTEAIIRSSVIRYSRTI